MLFVQRVYVAGELGVYGGRIIGTFLGDCWGCCFGGGCCAGCMSSPRLPVFSRFPLDIERMFCQYYR
jgi:hypothetical protein